MLKDVRLSIIIVINNFKFPFICPKENLDFKLYDGYLPPSIIGVILVI